MKRFSRRGLLAAGALLPVLGLAACQTQTLSQIILNVKLVAGGLAAAEASIAAIPGVPTAALTQIDSCLLIIQADAAKLAAAIGTPATGLVQEIGQAVQALAAIALPLLPAGSVAEALLQAAVSLLPEILAAAGVLGAVPAAVYSPAQARLLLAAYAV